MQEMDLELLKERWNNRAWIIAYIWTNFAHLFRDITWYRQSVKELSKPHKEP